MRGSASPATVVVPPSSSTAPSATASVTAGAASSSVIVPVPVAVPNVALTGPLSTTFTCSSGSSVPSPTTVTATTPLVSPAAMVSVPDASAV